MHCSMLLSDRINNKPFPVTYFKSQLIAQKQYVIDLRLSILHANTVLPI